MPAGGSARNEFWLKGLGIQIAVDQCARPRPPNFIRRDIRPFAVQMSFCWHSSRIGGYECLVRRKGKVVKPRMFLLAWVRRIRVIGFSIVASLLLATGAWAQVTFTVNTTDDGVDINPGDGICSTVPPPAPHVCTLRAAIMEANRAPAPGGAKIILHASALPYTLQIFPTIADGEADGDLNLIVPAGYNTPGPTTITGDGAASTTIDANKIDRIFRIDTGRSVSISGVALINGNAANQGGGIYNAGSLHLTHSLIMHNVAFRFGGGIYADSGGTVDVDFSVFSANSTTVVGDNGGGGGIYAVDGAVNVALSTLDGNSGGEGGGAISSYSATVKLDRSTVSRNIAFNGGGLMLQSGFLFVTNSTISENKASGDGGGVYNYGVARVYNSTIAYNQADTDADGQGDGGGIWNGTDKTFEVHNSLLAGNRLVFDNSNSDCYGFLVLHGVTGFEGGEQCSGVGSVIFIDSATDLGTLKNNGGPTETIALLPPSTLIGSGAAEECNDADAHHLTSDQRGNPRPPILRACDIGAFEYNELFRSSFDPPLP
jgi:CSLREA domain-containing protein